MHFSDTASNLSVSTNEFTRAFHVRLAKLVFRRHALREKSTFCLVIWSPACAWLRRGRVGISCGFVRMIAAMRSLHPSTLSTRRCCLIESTLSNYIGAAFVFVWTDCKSATILALRNSMNRSPLRLGFLVFAFMLACLRVRHKHEHKAVTKAATSISRTSFFGDDALMNDGGGANTAIGALALVSPHRRRGQQHGHLAKRSHTSSRREY